MLTWAPVEAVILDMDGLLIDTEPVWRAAQSAVFAGIGVALSERDLIDSTGQPVEELIPIWRQRRPSDSEPGSPPTDAPPSASAPTDDEVTDDEVADRITNRVIAHVKAEGQPMPGVTAAIALFERCGLRLAIASSSPLRLINAVCDRLGLTRIAVRCSAREEVRGKPAPDVYSPRPAGSASPRRAAWRWKTPRTGSRRPGRRACAASPCPTRSWPAIPATAKRTWS